MGDGKKQYYEPMVISLFTRFFYADICIKLFAK